MRPCLLAGPVGAKGVRIARAESFVDDDVPARADLKPGGVGELGARTNARRDHGEIDGEARAIVQNRLHAIRLLHKIGDDTSEPEIDPRAAELVRQRLGHLGVHRRQDVSAALDDGDGETAMTQVLGEFEADEPRPDQKLVPTCATCGCVASV